MIDSEEYEQQDTVHVLWMFAAVAGWGSVLGIILGFILARS